MKLHADLAPQAAKNSNDFHHQKEKGSPVKKYLLAALVIGSLAACGESADQAALNVRIVGGDKTQQVVLSEFKEVMQHCPGISKYSKDIEYIHYDREFTVKLSSNPTVIPAEARPVNEQCHYGLEQSGVQVSKRVCAWLCTGKDMTGIDGNTRLVTNGNIVRPDPGQLQAQAERGDIRAQRELAYSFAEWPYEGQQKNRVLACAWYLAAYNTAVPSQKAIDEKYVTQYCGALEPDLLNTAKHQARGFLAKAQAQKL